MGVFSDCPLSPTLRGVLCVGHARALPFHRVSRERTLNDRQCRCAPYHVLDLCSKRVLFPLFLRKKTFSVRLSETFASNGKRLMLDDFCPEVKARVVALFQQWWASWKGALGILSGRATDFCQGGVGHTEGLLAGVETGFREGRGKYLRCSTSTRP